MANTNLTGLFTNIANSIRAKDGTTAPIAAIDFANRINAIPTGSGFDMASLNYVEIAAPSSSEYSTLPNLTPYVDDFSKIVVMYWCGNSAGSIYVYIRGLNGNKVTFLEDIHRIQGSRPPQFVSPNEPDRFYFLNGNLSGLNVCFIDTSITLSTAFAHTLVMLYEN